MLMSISIEARNGHERQRNTPTRHAARLSGGVGLVCRTPRLDPTTAGCVPQAKALSSPAPDQGAGISGGHPGRAAALAGDQPGREKPPTLNVGTIPFVNAWLALSACHCLFPSRWGC